jgi:uncharacterized protein
MSKELLKKYLPDTDKIKSHKNLQFLGDRLHEPNLWHLNRRSVARAFGIGLFCAWIPTPTQMAISAISAFYLKANLPIAVGLVWITNPITMPPLFYFAYRVGLLVMGRSPSSEDFSFSLDGLLSGLGDIWAPFLLGCLIVGSLCSSAGYYGINYFWRKNIANRWYRRQQKRAGIEVEEPIDPIQYINIWLIEHPGVKHFFSNFYTQVEILLPKANTLALKAIKIISTPETYQPLVPIYIKTSKFILELFDTSLNRLRK